LSAPLSDISFFISWHEIREQKLTKIQQTGKNLERNLVLNDD